MRAFAFFCLLFGCFWAYTAVDAMMSGNVRPMRGKNMEVHRRDDPKSQYQKYLMSRWLAAGGFIVLAGVMNYFAGKFDDLAKLPPEPPTQLNDES